VRRFPSHFPWNPLHASNTTSSSSTRRDSAKPHVGGCLYMLPEPAMASLCTCQCGQDLYRPLLHPHAILPHPALLHLLLLVGCCGGWCAGGSCGGQAACAGAAVGLQLFQNEPSLRHAAPCRPPAAPPASKAMMVSPVRLLGTSKARLLVSKTQKLLCHLGHAGAGWVMGGPQHKARPYSRVSTTTGLPADHPSPPVSHDISLLCTPPALSPCQKLLEGASMEGIQGWQQPAAPLGCTRQLPRPRCCQPPSADVEGHHRQRELTLTAGVCGGCVECVVGVGEVWAEWQQAGVRLALCIAETVCIPLLAHTSDCPSCLPGGPA
jgi:hypothetical protein